MVNGSQVAMNQFKKHMYPGIQKCIEQKYDPRSRDDPDQYKI